LDAKHGRNALPALRENQDDEKQSGSSASENAEEQEQVPDMPSLVRQESGPVED
jgi:hypothetical protein